MYKHDNSSHPKRLPEIWEIRGRDCTGRARVVIVRTGTETRTTGVGGWKMRRKKHNDECTRKIKTLARISAAARWEGMENKKKEQ
jgi:hypothetical protein